MESNLLKDLTASFSVEGEAVKDLIFSNLLDFAISVANVIDDAYSQVDMIKDLVLDTSTYNYENQLLADKLDDINKLLTDILGW